MHQQPRRHSLLTTRLTGLARLANDLFWTAHFRAVHDDRADLVKAHDAAGQAALVKVSYRAGDRGSRDERGKASGRQHVDPDPGWAKLLRKVARQHVERGLRRAVRGKPRVRHEAEAGRARDVYDVPAESLG